MSFTFQAYSGRIGDWTYGTQYVAIITAEGYRNIAQRPDDLDEGEWEKQARLMAALPDLLAALEQMVLCYAKHEGYSDMPIAHHKQPVEVRNAMTAIAKAIGVQP